jgi:hypothetical protein
VGWLAAFVQFAPLSLFATYAFWPGTTPSARRFDEAFVLGAAASVVQLALLLPRRAPLNRLSLAGSVYLLAGGAAVLAGAAPLLHLFAVLKETAIFVALLAVGAVTTLASPAGYVGIAHPDAGRVRSASLALLALTAGGLAASLAFQGSLRWSVAVPLLVLTLANRLLARRLVAGAVAARQ